MHQKANVHPDLHSDSSLSNVKLRCKSSLLSLRLLQTKRRRTRFCLWRGFSVWVFGVKDLGCCHRILTAVVSPVGLATTAVRSEIFHMYLFNFRPGLCFRSAITVQACADALLIFHAQG